MIYSLRSFSYGIKYLYRGNIGIIETVINDNPSQPWYNYYMYVSMYVGMYVGMSVVCQINSVDLRGPRASSKSFWGGKD